MKLYLMIGGVVMKLNKDIQISKIELDGHEIPIPTGFDDFLNQSNCWGYRKDASKETNQNEASYERKVVLENGTLRTYLISKEKSKTKNQVAS